MNETTTTATALHRAAFGVPPSVAASAPGRVNLIGEHLDYNGGPVLPLAIERRTVVHASPAGKWRCASTLAPGVEQRDPAGARTGHWSDYLVGVVRALRLRDAAPTAANVSVTSSIPPGAGLASSGALVVAAAAALSLLARRRLEPAELVDVAFEAEHDYVGVRCGRMDHAVAALGAVNAALQLETATSAWQHVPFSARVWIAETGVAHRLTSGELNTRRSECEQAVATWRNEVGPLGHLAALRPADLVRAEAVLPPPLFRRVRHVVTETQRTRAATAALVAGEDAVLGALLLEGHESLRQDYESTVPEADLIVQAAVRHGAHGARLTGAGWGGSVLVLAPPASERAVIDAVQQEFRAAFGRLPRMWSSRAASGVRPEPVA